MNEKREIVYWDRDGEEHLTHEDKNEAIEAILEVDNKCDELEICGYARMKKPTVECFASDILDDALISLDCNYDLGPVDDSTDATDEMKSAAEVFANEILKEYKPWACEIITREKVDVEAWIKEHRPDWNED